MERNIEEGDTTKRQEIKMDSSDLPLLSEPYKINSVEKICFKSHDERLEALKAVHFNPFRLRHEDIIIDLLTDSGTNSISVVQRSHSLMGDESYAGASSFTKLMENVQLLTGFENVLPFYQKYLCEQILCEVLGKAGGVVVSNTFTYTMEASLKENKMNPLPLVTTDITETFGGDLNMNEFRNFVSENGTGSIDFVIVNAPSELIGGLPVSLENMKEVANFCNRHSIPVFLETSMYAENSWFIKNFEMGQSNRELMAIAQEMFSYFDGCILSMTRDAMGITGNIFACRDKELILKLQPSLILKGGFISYGGMAGRLLETSAIGILEAFDEIYIDFRFKEMRMIREYFRKNDVPIIGAIGTNTIFIDVDQIQKQMSIPYLAWSLNCAAYVHGGVRGAEYGKLTGPGSNLPDNHPIANKELIKLGIPRRTYTLCHYLYVAHVFGELIKNSRFISGMRLVDSQVGRLRHLKMKLEPLEPEKLNSTTLKEL